MLLSIILVEEERLWELVGAGEGKGERWPVW